ncbi:MAG: hypothetical protein ABL900_16980 [Burkholderiaceae bacterium]
MPTPTIRKTALKTKSRKPARPARPAQAAEPRLSRTRRPTALAVADWQTALRRQFGREQAFELENLGAEPVFSDFRVHNPAGGTRYRVAIRGSAPGQNFCACADFATNNLGTCKHIEFTLAKLEGKPGGKAALARGFQGEYSEVWLDYAGARRVRLRAAAACPPALLARAKALFDASAGWALPWERLVGLEEFVQAAQECGHDLRCHDDVWQFAAQIRDGERRQTALAEAYPTGAADEALKGLLKVELYPYQAEGAPLRRAPRVGGVPDFAQAPMEKRVRAFHRA